MSKRAATKTKAAAAKPQALKSNPFLDAIDRAVQGDEPSPKAILQAIAEPGKATDGGLVAFLKQLKTKEHDALGKSLVSILELLPLQHSPGDADKENHEDANDQPNHAFDLNAQPVQDLVRVVVDIVTKLVSDDDFVAPESVYLTVCRLHDLIGKVGAVNSRLQGQILSICENWILQERENFATLVPQTISSLLANVLEDPKSADIQRLYKLRNSLSLIAIGDDNSETLRRDLLKCLIQQFFLGNDYGRKFIVFLFSLEPGFIDTIHRTIKSAVPHCKKSQLDTYAEIYFKAWSKSTGQFRLKIETNCIQDFIFLSIHTRNPKTIKSVQRIVRFFADKKLNREKHVDEMLQRLYDPILWRSLQVANPIVRENALVQLGLVFPLVRAEQPQREIDEITSLGFQRLIGSLDDTHPSVRRQAVISIGRVLSLYWEVFPFHTLQRIVEQLVTQTVFDKTSVHVREAVIGALEACLENHMSHSLLKEALPKLGVMIGDTSDRVRLQFVRLLQTVNRIKLIRFYAIVTHGELLEAIQNEKSDKVQAALSELMLSSYFPWSKHEVKELLQRCISMVEENRHSAVTFYASLNISDVPPTTIAKFIYKMFTKVVEPWLFNKEKEAEIAATEQEEAIAEAKRAKLSSTHFHLDDVQGIRSVMTIIALLWDKVETRLMTPENHALVTALVKCFSDGSLVLTEKFVPNCDALYRIAAHLPQSGLPIFSKVILDQLPDTGSDLQSSNFLQCLFSWGEEYRTKVLEMLNRWFCAPLTALGITVANSDQSDTNTDDPASMAANIRKALKLVLELKTGPSWIRDEMILSDSARGIVFATAAYKDALSKRIVEDEAFDCIDDLGLLSCFAEFYKLALHAAHNRGGNDDTQEIVTTNCVELVYWLKEFIVPRLTFKSSVEEFFDATNASTESLESTPPIVYAAAQVSLRLLADSATTGMTKATGGAAIVELLEKLLTTVAPPEFTNEVCVALWKVSLQLLIRGLVDDEITATPTLQPEIIAPLLAASMRRDQSENNKISALGLRHVLNGISTTARAMAPLKQTFIKTIYSAITAEHDDEGAINVQHEVDASDLPQDAAFILSTIQKHASLLGELCGYLSEVVVQTESYEVDVWKSLQLAAIVVLSPTPVPKPAVGGLQSLLLGFLPHLRETDANHAALRDKTERLLKQLGSFDGVSATVETADN